MPHLPLTTFDGIEPTSTARDTPRDRDARRPRVHVGFCMGGRLAFLSGDVRHGPRRRDRLLRLARRAAPRRHHPPRRTSRPRSTARCWPSSAVRTRAIGPAMAETFEAALDAAAVRTRWSSTRGAARLLRPQGRRVRPTRRRPGTRCSRSSAAAGGLTWGSCGGSRRSVRGRRRRPGQTPPDGARPPPRPTKPNASGSPGADQARLTTISPASAAYADRSWMPPAQGGTRAGRRRRPGGMTPSISRSRRA